MGGLYHDSEGGYFGADGEYNPPKIGDMVNGKPYVPAKKHTVCQTCFHKHYWGEFCHVFFMEEKEIVPTEEEKAALRAKKKGDKKTGQRQEEEEVDMFATDSEEDDGSGFEGSDLSEEVREERSVLRLGMIVILILILILCCVIASSLVFLNNYSLD